MSDFSLSLEALDASNRVLSLLAGATSQSFNQIGYGVVEGNEGPSPLSGADGLNSEAGELPGGIGEAEAVSSTGLIGPARSLQDQDSQIAALTIDAEGAALALGDGVAYSGSADAEMDDQSFWGLSGQNLSNSEASDSALGAQADATNLLESSSSLVSDFLSDLLARLTSEESLESDLSGENQAAFRGFLDTLGGVLDDSARDFFQSHVQGQVKGMTGDIIDQLGVDALEPVIDPLHNFDYYGTSADLIQSTRDALSLSSIALPPIGPTVAWVRDEFLQRSAS